MQSLELAREPPALYGNAKKRLRPAAIQSQIAALANAREPDFAWVTA
jgi:hypothetical protein